MKPSVWNAPEPTTVSSAILFHCATVFPGGNAAVALPVVTGDAATAATANASCKARVSQRENDVGVAAIFGRKTRVDLMLPPSGLQPGDHLREERGGRD